MPGNNVHGAGREQVVPAQGDPGPEPQCRPGQAVMRLQEPTAGVPVQVTLLS